MTDIEEEAKRTLHVLETGDIASVLKLRKTSLVEICQKLDIQPEGTAAELKVKFIHYYTDVKPEKVVQERGYVEVGFNQEYQSFIAEILDSVKQSNLSMHENMKIQTLNLKTIAEISTKKGAGFIKIEPYKHGDDDLDNYLARFETLCWNSNAQTFIGVVHTFERESFRCVFEVA
jgi:hypothetical protein